MQKVIQIVPMSKSQGDTVCGSLTVTSKMPCKSYSLPTESCITGYAMSKIKGSICSHCYADKGNYARYANNIKPAQFARLDSIDSEYWVSGMVALIGNDQYFRWHDSGDLQSVSHLEKIVAVANSTPNCKHWLPTREYGIIKDYVSKHGSIPKNLVIRLSAMYPDKPVTIPKSLQNIKGLAMSNVHTDTPIGNVCNAPKQNGECKDCRLCWSTDTVSYAMH